MGMVRSLKFVGEVLEVIAGAAPYIYFAAPVHYIIICFVGQVCVS